MPDSPINLSELQWLFFTQDGLQHMTQVIRDAKERGGAAWLELFKKENPGLVFAIDLIANKTFDEAYKILFNEYGLLVMPFHEAIKNIHCYLRAEIDKPRF